jgi:hypothetical protein
MMEELMRMKGKVCFDLTVAHSKNDIDERKREGLMCEFSLFSKKE